MLLWLTHYVSPFFLGRPERLSLKTCRFSFLWSRLAEDGIVLGDVSWQFGLSLFSFRRFFLLGIGLEFCMKWAEAAEFFDPTWYIHRNYNFQKTKIKQIKFSRILKNLPYHSHSQSLHDKYTTREDKIHH